jgi:zinc finger protein
MENEEDDYLEVPPEIETTLKCPACSSNLYSITYSTEIPIEGRITIQTYVCHKCLYKHNSIFYEDRENPKRITMKISEPHDMNVLVYRSPNAVLAIPEIKAEIAPGEESSGELTTVEGILLTISEKLDLMFDAESQEFKNIRQTLDLAIDSRAEITLIIEDWTGKSKIESEKAVTETIL